MTWHWHQSQSLKENLQPSTMPRRKYNLTTAHCFNPLVPQSVRCLCQQVVTLRDKASAHSDYQHCKQPAPCAGSALCAGFDRDLDKQEAEIKEKLKQEKKREERKNREAFSELLREDLEEGFIKPKMRWRVCQ